VINGFIFDLDGTLLDSETVWVEAYGELLRARGFPVSPAEALKAVYGKSYRDVYTETLRRLPMLGWTSEEMALHFRAAFRQVSAGRDVRIPSSIELLKTLAREFPVCVVSGASREDVDAGVRLAGIAGLLRFTLAAEDYEPGKPSPAGFLLAATKLALPPARCLVFEDSAAGVAAAKAAGMWCVALARPGRPAQNLSAADLVLENLADFSLSAFPPPNRS